LATSLYSFLLTKILLFCSLKNIYQRIMNGSYKATLIFDTFEVISRVCNKIGNNDKPVCIKKLQKFDVKFTKFGYFVVFKIFIA